MRPIAWSSKSLRAFKRMVRQNPQLRPMIEETLEKLAEDPFHPALKTHKLSGEFAGIWACSIDQSTIAIVSSLNLWLTQKKAKEQFYY